MAPDRYLCGYCDNGPNRNNTCDEIPRENYCSFAVIEGVWVVLEKDKVRILREDKNQIRTLKEDRKYDLADPGLRPILKMRKLEGKAIFESPRPKPGQPETVSQ